MFVEGEPVRAFCPLASPEDEKNRVFLTDESLVIKRKGKNTSFERSSISAVAIRNRRYLIPVIAGGIMAPLAIAALIGGIGQPWILFMLMLSGVFLFYHGIQGGPALTVFTSVKDYDTFIPMVTASLRSFVSYVSWQLKANDEFLYLVLTPEELAAAETRGKVPEGTALYLHERELPATPGSHILRMQTGHREIRLRFHAEPGGDTVRITLGNAVPVEFLLEK